MPFVFLASFSVWKSVKIYYFWKINYLKNVCVLRYWWLLMCMRLKCNHGIIFIPFAKFKSIQQKFLS